MEEPTDILDPEPESPEHPWLQQVGESAKAFDAFSRYRDLLAKRTFEAVARQLQCSGANVRRWALQWNWADRVWAYDSYLDEQDRSEQVRERREMRKRQAHLGVTMQSIAAQGLKELQDRMQQKLPLNLEPSDIARMMDVGARLERGARGEDTAHMYTNIQVVIAESLQELDPDDDDGSGQQQPRLPS
jgi:hypothetical protein